MGFGDYPAEYDRKIHGSYDPARYYGKRDTPFSEVKLSELSAWIGRRRKTPPAFMSLMSRAWWRWQHKYIHVRKTGIAPYIQLCVGCCVFFYIINYKSLQHESRYKYH